MGQGRVAGLAGYGTDSDSDTVPRADLRAPCKVTHCSVTSGLEETACCSGTSRRSSARGSRAISYVL